MMTPLEEMKQLAKKTPLPKCKSAYSIGNANAYSAAEKKAIIAFCKAVAPRQALIKTLAEVFADISQYDPDDCPFEAKALDYSLASFKLIDKKRDYFDVFKPAFAKSTIIPQLGSYAIQTFLRDGPESGWHLRHANNLLDTQMVFGHRFTIFPYRFVQLVLFSRFRMQHLAQAFADNHKRQHSNSVPNFLQAAKWGWL